MNEIEMLEKEIIGSFIVDKDTHKYIDRLTEEFFMLEKSRKFFKAIKDLYIEKTEINTITVNARLTSGVNKKDTNVLKEICNYVDGIVNTATVQKSIERLEEIHFKRKIGKILSEANKDIINADKEAVEIKNKIINQLEELKFSNSINCYEKISDVFANTLEQIEYKKNNGEDFSLYTGFAELDKFTDGLHANELTAIGARPGTGKTAFALNIATNIARKGKKVYFCSLEMSSEQLMQRIIASYTNINTQFLRTGRVENNEILTIGQCTNKILNLDLKIDSKTRYIEEIENLVYNLKNQNEIDVLIIDYLTLLKSKQKYQSRELEVADISRKLKLLALTLNIPVIVLVQLNRDAENKTPNMANIRESGSIEQNCDNIIFLYDEKQEERKTIQKIKIILEKQRQGTTGTFYLAFYRNYSKFVNIIK